MSDGKSAGEMAQVLEDPGLAEFSRSFKERQVLFHEGDDSRELYILVSGEVEIIKGKKRIARARDKGRFFGEMSFLLGGKRTATLKALTPVAALCVPEGEAGRLISGFPGVALALMRDMAGGLKETTSSLYGLKEFCDHLPEAVVVTDEKGRIVSWNASVESNCGKKWEQLHEKPFSDVFAPANEKDALPDARTEGSPDQEGVFLLQHPEKGERLMAAKNTILRDSLGRFMGVLSMLRDVTEHEAREKRYRRLRLGLFILPVLCLAAAVIAFSVMSRMEDPLAGLPKKHRAIMNDMEQDWRWITPLLAHNLSEKDRKAATGILEDFFKKGLNGDMPYKGILVLDPEKEVVSGYSPKTPDMEKLLGHGYSSVVFQEAPDSAHKVLVPFRVDEDNPRGKKGVEVAFEILYAEEFLGWLVFQMDADALKKRFGADEKDLLKLQFHQPLS